MASSPLRTPSLALVFACALMRMAHAESTPEVIFAELRGLQSEGRFVECSTRGREAAPGLVNLEVVWLIVAECEASERRWCEANEAVARFLASGGASEARMAAARQLGAETLERCNEGRAARECVAAHDRGDWNGCADTCGRAGDNPLPAPGTLLAGRCLLRAGGRCAEARATLTSRDLEALDDEDSDRLDACVASGTVTAPVASTPGPPADAWSGAAPWLIGFGGAAVVTGVVLLLVADGTADDMATLSQGPDYLTRYAELESDHRTQLVAGHISTWAGLALVGSGVLLVVLDDDPEPTRATISPTLTRGGLVLSLVGGF